MSHIRPSPWSAQDDDILEGMKEAGCTTAQIARVLGRTEDAVRSRRRAERPDKPVVSRPNDDAGHLAKVLASSPSGFFARHLPATYRVRA